MSEREHRSGLEELESESRDDWNPRVVPGKRVTTSRVPLRMTSERGSGGSPIEESLRQELEQSISADLSGVRVHTDAAAQAQTQEHGARALAIGQDIHFASGEYNPQSRAGRELIAHEVAHTVQQRGAATTQAKLRVSTPGDRHEREADAFGAAFTAGLHMNVRAGTAARSIQRSPNPHATTNPATTNDPRPKKEVSSKAMTRLKLAREAIDFTKGIMAFGAGNQAEALLATRMNSYYRMRVVRTSKYWELHDSVKPIAARNPEALRAAKASIAQGGNCGEHADVAFAYLRLNANGEYLVRGAVTGLDHAFVFLGNPQSTSESDAELTISDPWPTNPTACLWEDHFAFSSDRNDIEIRYAQTGDGNSPMEVIRAGLKLTDAGKRMIEKKDSKKKTKQRVEDGMGGWVWEHVDAVAVGHYVDANGDVQEDRADYNYVEEPQPATSTGGSSGSNP